MPESSVMMRRMHQADALYAKRYSYKLLVIRLLLAYSSRCIA